MDVDFVKCTCCAAAVKQTYRQLQASALQATSDGSQLAIAADTGPDTKAAGRSLTARALYPDITAKALKAASEIVAARFYVPSSMLTKLLREADCVATVGLGAVRFKGSSACCSLYATLDLQESALGVARQQNGRTSVDFGPGSAVP